MADIVSTIRGLKNLVTHEGVAAEKIAEVEAKLGLKFAADYRAYLAAFGRISARHIEITGISGAQRLDVVGVTLSSREAYQLPPEMYVVEDTGIEGILILQNSSGQIFEFRNNRTKKIFDCLADYLLSL